MEDMPAYCVAVLAAEAARLRAQAAVITVQDAIRGDGCTDWQRRQRLTDAAESCDAGIEAIKAFVRADELHARATAAAPAS